MQQWVYFYYFSLPNMTNYFYLIVYVFWIIFQTAGDLSINFTQIADKYGVPVAVGILLFIYFSREKKQSDQERTKLMERNNELTEELIETIKKGFSCNYK